MTVGSKVYVKPAIFRFALQFLAPSAMAPRSSRQCAVTNITYFMPFSNHLRQASIIWTSCRDCIHARSPYKDG